MDRSISLRRDATDAERIVWDRLRHAQLGVKFRRQHEIAGYYVDFVCLERMLVVELDGGQHAVNVAHDEKRTRLLESLGIRVLRFWNNDVLARVDDVLAAIVASLESPSPPHPNPVRPVGRSGASEPAVLSDAPLTPRRSRGRGSRERIERAQSVAPDSNVSANSLPELPAGSYASANPLQQMPTDSHASASPLPQAPLGGEGWGEREKRTIASPHGFRDTPLRRNLELRARLYTLIRTFFSTRHVLEVETPILSRSGNTDPNIESFRTHFTGHRDAGPPERWLRTSPEFPLKRLLAAGVGDCYELGRVFRNGEAGRRHNPEFTMLEWYRAGWDHRALMTETCDLVSAALQLTGRSAEVARYSYAELFHEYLGLDAFTASEPALAAPLAEFSINPDGLGRDDWLDLLITHRIPPQFPRDRITLIHDYPASQCALARIRAGNPPVAERFELYLGPYELANGYHELNDAAEQRARFERDNARRRERGLETVPPDENLLAVLDAMPACAGVALGVERLLMCLAGTDDIRDVLAYAFAEA